MAGGLEDSTVRALRLLGTKASPEIKVPQPPSAHQEVNSSPFLIQRSPRPVSPLFKEHFPYRLRTRSKKHGVCILPNIQIHCSNEIFLVS